MDPNSPRINNMNDLFKYAIEHQTATQSLNSSAPLPMDQERRQFLERALAENTVDVAQELLKGINQLKAFVKSVQDNNNQVNQVDLDQTLDTTDKLLQYVGQIDFAHDFFTMGGYSVLIDMLNIESPEVQIAALDLAAEMLQNNPTTQALSLTNGIMELLLEKLLNIKWEQVRLKVMYCLSCLVRNNQEAFECFLELGGIDKFIQILVMRTDSNRMCTKFAFLMNNLCQTNPELLDIIIERGLIDLFVTILQRPLSDTHEFLLSILKTGCFYSEEFVLQCRRPELNLLEVLKNILTQCGTQEEYFNLIDNINHLLIKCFNDNLTSDDFR